VGKTSVPAPKYRVVSSSYVKNNALPELYANIRKTIESRIATTARSINICVDGWSSLTHVQCISITIQWLTKNFKMHSYVLSTQSLQGEHSADNIAAAMGRAVLANNCGTTGVTSLRYNEGGTTKGAGGTTKTFLRLFRFYWEHNIGIHPKPLAIRSLSAHRARAT
jgi:hypothetical protein